LTLIRESAGFRFFLAHAIAGEQETPRENGAAVM